jgi:branched-chain amino acid transport system substrate-binding protein
MKTLVVCSRALAAFVALALLCSLSPAAQAADPVEIPAIIPLTGQGAFIGKAYVAAFSAVESVVNKSGGIRGRSLKITVQDDASNPQNALQLFNQDVAQKKNAILGAPLAAECNAMAPMAKDGPVLYCLTPGIRPAPGSYVFSADPATEDKMLISVRYFLKRGYTRFAAITTTDASGQDADRGLTGAFAQNPGAVMVAHEHYAVPDLSVVAQIERIKAANPQVLIGYATGTPFGTILRGVRDVGLTIPVWTTSGNLTYAQMAQYKDFLPEELDFPATAVVAPDVITDRQVRAAVDRFRQAIAAVGVKPEYIQSPAYDPAMLLVEALRKVGPDASASQVRAALAAVKGFAGAEGRYDMQAVPQRGLAPSQLFVVRWDPAKNDWVAIAKPGGDPR